MPRMMLVPNVAMAVARGMGWRVIQARHKVQTLPDE